MKKMACWSLIAFALLGGALGAAAENLTSAARLLRDERIVNNGQAYDLLKPVNEKPYWDNMSPMSGKVSLELWFPVSGPVQLRTVNAQSRHERATVTMFNRQGAEQQRIQTADKLDFRFKSPLTTNALRFEFTDITNRDHEVLTYLDWHLEGDASGRPLYTIDDLQVTCPAEFNVFPLGAPAKLQVTVADRLKQVKTFRLATELKSFQGRVVQVEKTVGRFSLSDSASREFPLEFRSKQQGPYLATIFLYDDERDVMLAAKRILVGWRDEALFEQGRVNAFKSPTGGKVVSIAERLREHGTIWGADATQSISGKGRQPGAQYFQKIKEGGGEMLMAFLRYSDFEPLPGVYNFEYFDHMVANAGRVGLGLEAGLWWWDFRGPTQFWLKDEHVRQRDGATGKGREGLYSLHSTTFSRHAFRAVELLLKRYKDCPEIWMWHPHPYGSVDHDGHGIYDFHPEALRGWAEYLQRKYGTLATLNQAYGGTYGAWSDVPVPAPLYEDLETQKDWQAVGNVVDVRPQWLDWLDFYHQGLLDFRVKMMQLVRKLDSRRAISGVNATGGVGKADLTFSKLAEYDAFYGDQGLNLLHYVRRLVAKRRFGLRLRHEDISPVTIGRRNFDAPKVVDRANWDMFQTCLLGAEHFNYVFTAWTDSPFWEQIFANPRAKRLVKEAGRSRLMDRPVGYLHSFTSDILKGRYNYQGITLYRWWLMNGFSRAMVLPGNFFEMFSDGGDLQDLAKMKVVVDDGSCVITEHAKEVLADYVKSGGKLMLFAPSGERTLETGAYYDLLRELGYGETDKLRERTYAPATLILSKNNPVFRRTISVPLNNWTLLAVPEGGTVLGRLGADPGAVLWPFGKGQVVLFGGLPGAINEADILDLWASKDKLVRQKASPVWANAERELGQLTGQITRDLAEWAGVPSQFSLNDDLLACVKENATEKFVYMYNEGLSQTPVFRMDLPKGRYTIEAETLEAKTRLGTFTAAQLAAPGVKLPALSNSRFMMLRIRHR
jgi:hypothetical protein